MESIERFQKGFIYLPRRACACSKESFDNRAFPGRLIYPGVKSLIDFNDRDET